jgi:hypothetical protein
MHCCNPAGVSQDANYREGRGPRGQTLLPTLRAETAMPLNPMRYFVQAEKSCSAFVHNLR